MKKEKIILAYSGGLDTSVILKWLVAFALSSIAFTLSKFAMDITLFMSRNFGFIRFPDEFTTGSSIMPHKKNPDVFELVRAKCNKIQALPNEIALISGINIYSVLKKSIKRLKMEFRSEKHIMRWLNQLPMAALSLIKTYIIRMRVV